MGPRHVDRPVAARREGRATWQHVTIASVLLALGRDGQDDGGAAPPMDDLLPTDPVSADHVRIVHRSFASTPALADAIATAATRTRRCAPQRAYRVCARGDGPRLPRDRAVLIRLARHRVLSLTQLQRLTFAGLHRSRVSRRVSALERSGWVSTWDDPRGLGGHVRYAVPTVAGLRWALRRIEVTTRGSDYARLIATMLRRDGRHPLPLERGEAPAWLTHLAEVNDVLVDLQVADADVVWASSWNRPLPNASHGVALPQPDAVVVMCAAGGPDALLFVEHDRGGESLRHFRARKVACYRALAQRPGLLQELTGYRAFRVVVTVNVGDPSDTARRIADLERCATGGLAGSIVRVVPAEVLRVTGVTACLTGTRAWSDPGRRAA